VPVSSAGIHPEGVQSQEGGNVVAAAALVIVGLVLVFLGLFAANGSVPLIGLGIVALIAAGYFQMTASRRA
jgi:hypothetical protein